MNLKNGWIFVNVDNIWSLTTNIFWAYNFRNLDIMQFVTFLVNLNTNVIPTTLEAKIHLIFPTIITLQQNVWKVWWNMGTLSRYWLPLILSKLFICHSDLNIQHSFLCFCGKFISHFLYLVKFLVVLIRTFTLHAWSH